MMEVIEEAMEEISVRREGGGNTGGNIRW